MPCLRRISLAARSSLLSRKQVEEISAELHLIYPDLSIEPTFIETTGDRDQKSSLRLMGKTDFFTRELDQMVARGESQIAVHSAKDLPEPLSEGLAVVALTRGVDPSDSLVLREGEALRPGMRIATSSVKREEAVRRLCPDLTFCDIRGDIPQRLAQLDLGSIDGVVVAEAALIRLGLTHRNRHHLEGTTTPYQGQLAVVARQDDHEMDHLFAPIDVRQNYTILHTGLDPSAHHLRGRIVHSPLIEIIPSSQQELSEARSKLKWATHLLFTSKSAVRLFCDGLNHPITIPAIAVGQATAHALAKRGMQVDLVAEEESSEGLTRALKEYPLEGGRVLWPHSALSRRALPNYFEKRGVQCCECILYTTRTAQPKSLMNLDPIDEIVFTSPSTVEAFLQLYGALPKNKQIWTQGDVTRQAVERLSEAILANK